MFPSFKNITALVTGASSGIGESMARELASQGANLILTARNLPRLEKEAEELRKKYGIQVSVFPGDLSQGETCQKLFQWTQRQKLQVDLLINNAGFAYNGEFAEEELQNIRAMLAVNVQALVELTRLFLPGMLERKKGGILNVASTAGFQGMPYLSLYAATKAFVISFSEALWYECGTAGVRVFCLCPGNTLTQFHQNAGIGKEKIFLSASAVDVARFALKKFLKSNRPAGIFGFWNKIMIYANRLASRRITVLVTSRMFQPNASRKQ